MSAFDEIALAEARRQLSLFPGVTVLSEWQHQPKSSAWMLRLCLELLGAEPTSAVFRYTEWEAVVDFSLDVWGKVQLHPALGERGISATFHHQQFNGGQHGQWPCRSGNICTASWLGNLAKSRNAVQHEPENTIERICWHVARAQEWLAAAASDDLVHTGEAFELPDFSVGKAQILATLIYQEDEGSFAEWQARTAQSGIAKVINLVDNKGWVIQSFLDASSNKTLYKPTWGSLLTGKHLATKQCLWIRLDELPVVNGWQVPATMQELKQALAAQGADLDALLAPLWKSFLLPDEVLLLVGAPIPKKVGEAPYRYHWQALQLGPPIKVNAAKSRLALLQNHLRSAHSLQWVTWGENWHPEDLQSRGRLTPALCEARVLLLGAGALGSSIAEQLVRMGVQNVTVVDGQQFEGGNLVRHVLTTWDLSESKAFKLAARLNSVNPLAKVTGLRLTLPATSPEFEQAAAGATLIIDATGEDSVLRLFPLPAANPDALFVSCSLSLYAKQLFFYAAQAGQFEKAKFDAWYAPFGREQDELAQRIELPRGAGCWHPLTPAPLNRIAGLAGAAVELLEQLHETIVTLPISLSHTWQVPLLAPAVKEMPLEPAALLS